MISLNKELGFSQPHDICLTSVLSDFMGTIYGAEFGVAWGGSVEIAAKKLIGRGIVWGFDTFSSHPKHLVNGDLISFPNGDNEATTMDPHYLKYGMAGLDISYQRDQLRSMSLNNAVLIQGLINNNSCINAGIPMLHYAHLDLDILESMQVAYSVSFPLIVEGGYLLMHDCHNFKRICDWINDEIIPSGKWDLVLNSQETLYCMFRKKKQS